MLTQLENTTLAIDPLHSSVAFSIRHMVVGKVNGILPVDSGSIDIDGSGQATLRTAIDVAALTTGREPRDQHLKSADFFDAENHPHAQFTADFRVSNFEEISQVSGMLTIKEITQPVTLEVTHVAEGENMEGVKMYSFEASAEINRKDFGLEFELPLPSGIKAISDKVLLQVQVEAATPAPESN